MKKVLYGVKEKALFKYLDLQLFNFQK